MAPDGEIDAGPAKHNEDDAADRGVETATLQDVAKPSA
jgi:hypothetical protein